MDTKDGIIGCLLIGIVALAGAIGYLSVVLPGSDSDDDDDETKYIYLTEPEPPFGLPDFSTAPNSTYFMFYNQTTGVKINVTLKDILEGVALYQEQMADPLHRGINDHKKMISYHTFEDQISGYILTGIDILDLLAKYDTNFGWDIDFTSREHGGEGVQTETLKITTGNFISKMYYGSEEKILLVIAANKQWLGESPLASRMGNFSIVGENFNSPLYNLAKINVTSNWTVEVIIDGIKTMELDPYNMTYGVTEQTYTYQRWDWWDYNRTYWGRNVSEIINYNSTLAAGDFDVYFETVDKFTAPFQKKYRAYNKTEIMVGISNNGTHVNEWTEKGKDLVNNSNYIKYEEVYDGIPLLATHLRMALVFKEQELGESGMYGRESQGEYDITIDDPPWPYPKYIAYRSGPYRIVVPGRTRDNYINHIKKIHITT